MIQDIYPHTFDNQFILREPKENDIVFFFEKRNVYMNDNHQFPTYHQVDVEVQYLFEIDQKHYYLALEHQDIPSFSYKATFFLRNLQPKHARFAAVTAFHLYSWYHSHRYCGCCGYPMEHATHERAMVCPKCRHMEYPKIAPAVIVGVIHKDSILMTRYANRAYKGHALIAGFCEIGETPEETVIREVKEEVGLNVKNIRYYKSQPWGFDSNLLMGFFADLDGDATISLDQEELAKARFMTRDEISDTWDDLSLTNEMIMVFKQQKTKD